MPITMVNFLQVSANFGILKSEVKKYKDNPPSLRKQKAEANMLVEKKLYFHQSKSPRLIFFN